MHSYHIVSPASLVSPAYADVTVKSTGAGKGMGMGGTMTMTTYIKGNKMRTDTVMGDSTRTMIFDVDAQRLYSFDSKKKEADAWDMKAFGASLQSSVDTSGMKTSIKPNGQTKQLAGKAASGYDMELTMPATMGGKDGMKMTVVLTGPIWIVKGAPGTEEYLSFYKGAVEKGWIFSDPRGAKGNPGQAKAMAEMYRQLADTGRHSVRAGDEHQDERRRSDGGHLREDGQHLDDPDGPVGRNRRARRGPLRAAGRLQDQGAEVASGRSLRL